jgi:hypothetical protein
MSANDGAVNQQVFQVWVSGAKLMQLLEDTCISPTGKALIDGIPVAIRWGKQAPLGTVANNPEDGGEKASALPLRADVNLRASAQEGQNFLPLLVCECYC